MTKAASLMITVLPSLDRLARGTLVKKNEAELNWGFTIACILQQFDPAQGPAGGWAMNFGLFRWKDQYRIDTRTLQGVALR